MAIGPKAKFVISAHDRTAAAFRGIHANLGRLTRAIGPLSAAVAGLAGVAGFGALVKSSLAAGDQLAKTADRLGLTTEALAGLHHAAQLTGAGIETTDMALQRMTRRVAEAAQGTGEAKAAIAELGLSAKNLAALSPDRQFTAIAEAMSGVSAQGDRVRLAMKLFDSEGVKLVNTLALGKEGLDAARAEAERYGVAISRVDAAQIEAANDAMFRAREATRGMALQMTVALAPAIAAVANEWQNMARDTEQVRAETISAMHAVGMAVGYAGDAVHGLNILWKLGESAVLDFRDIVTRAFLDVAEAYNRIAEILPGIDPVPLDNLRRASQEFSIAATQATLDFRALAREELPSDKVNAFFAKIEEGAKKAASAMAEVRASAVGAESGMPEKPDLTEKERETLQKSLNQVREHLMTRELMEQESFLRRVAIVQQNVDAGIVSEMRGHALVESLNEQHQARLSQISGKGFADRQKFAAMSTTAQTRHVLGELKTLTAGVAQYNKVMFRINQIAGIADATISTYQGAALAIRTYPPPLSFAMAAAQIAAGLAQVNAIRSTTFSGSGGGTTPSMAGGTPTVNNQPVPAPATTQQSAAPPPQTTVIIPDGIDPDKWYRGETMYNLINAINDAQRDGAVLIQVSTA